MKKLKKILFPTDFSRCANQALGRAFEMARQFDAELHMLHATVLHEEDPYHAGHHLNDSEEVQQRLRRTALDEMDSLIRSYDATDLKVVKAQERGIAAASVILEYCNDQDIDLVIMGTHGRRGLERLLLGSVAEEVVRTAPCPVMTVREQEAPKSARAIERVLVPIDFSEHSKMALANAKELAAVYGARIQLLHVVEETVHPAFYVTGKSSIFELIPDILEKSKTALRELWSEVKGPEVEFETHVVEGQAARDIAKFAEENGADLIVISTHGLTGIEHFLVGSVTEKVVRLSTVPVLTLKAFGKSLVDA